MITPVVQLVLEPEFRGPFLHGAAAAEVGGIEGEETVAQAGSFKAGRRWHGAGSRSGFGVAGLKDDGRRMKRLDFQIGLPIALFLDGKFTNGHLRQRRRERAAANVIALFAPEAAPHAIGLEIIESRQLVQRPGGIYGRVPLEVGPEHNLSFRRAKETLLRTVAEAVIFNPCRKFLFEFKRTTDGSLAALIASKGQINALGAQRRIDGRIDDLVKSFFQRSSELQPHTVAQRIERPPLRIIGCGVLGPKFVLDALQGASLPGRIEHLLERIP